MSREILYLRYTLGLIRRRRGLQHEQVIELHDRLLNLVNENPDEWTQEDAPAAFVHGLYEIDAELKNEDVREVDDSTLRMWLIKALRNYFQFVVVSFFLQKGNSEVLCDNIEMLSLVIKTNRTPPFGGSARRT